ncbi:hypothetical protein C8J57DRAFT_1478367 [Mycena rebaudengoi]|nr:hypothetical protein C8J57DRAFT_1478367 [Mycena rebaudengoi]
MGSVIASARHEVGGKNLIQNILLGSTGGPRMYILTLDYLGRYSGLQGRSGANLEIDMVVLDGVLNPTDFPVMAFDSLSRFRQLGAGFSKCLNYWVAIAQNFRFDHCRESDLTDISPRWVDYTLNLCFSTESLACLPEMPRLGGPPEHSEGGEGHRMAGTPHTNEEQG